MPRDKSEYLLRKSETYIVSKRFGNTISLLERRYPEGCPDHLIASVLRMEEEAVQAEYDRIIEKLRGLMGC